MWAVSVFVENTATLCANIYVTTSIQQHSPLAENTDPTTPYYFVCFRQPMTKGLRIEALTKSSVVQVYR